MYDVELALEIASQIHKATRTIPETIRGGAIPRGFYRFRGRNGETGWDMHAAYRHRRGAQESRQSHSHNQSLIDRARKDILAVTTAGRSGSCIPSGEILRVASLRS